MKIEKEDEQTADMKRNEHPRESLSSDSDIRVGIYFSDFNGMKTFHCVV